MRVYADASWPRRRRDARHLRACAGSSPGVWCGCSVLYPGEEDKPVACKGRCPCGRSFPTRPYHHVHSETYRITWRTLENTHVFMCESECITHIVNVWVALMKLHTHKLWCVMQLRSVICLWITVPFFPFTCSGSINTTPSDENERDVKSFLQTLSDIQTKEHQDKLSTLWSKGSWVIIVIVWEPWWVKKRSFAKLTNRINKVAVVHKIPLAHVHTDLWHHTQIKFNNSTNTNEITQTHNVDWN